MADQKIDIEKIKQASKLLRDILTAIQTYDSFYKQLTPQEKAVLGGFVFSYINIWDDFDLVAVLADRPLGVALINRLLDFFNNPHPQSQQPPKIKPFGSN